MTDAAAQHLERRVGERLPMLGDPGVRDPENICEPFTPGKPTLRGDCDTDGHYLCDECVHRRTCAGCGRRPMSCECRRCSRCWKYPPGSCQVSGSSRPQTCQCSIERCASCRQLWEHCDCEHDLECPFP